MERARNCDPLKLEPLYAEEAKQRQSEGGKRGGQEAGRGRPKRGSGKSSRKANRSQQKSRQRAAKAAKSNPKYVAALKKLDVEAKDLAADHGNLCARDARRAESCDGSGNIAS